MTNKRAIGTFYEDEASQYLSDLGFFMICKNYYSPYGEIDLIMSMNSGLYFIEVKFRSSDAFGSPRDAITYKKMERMKRSAMYYIKNECLAYTPFKISFLGITKVSNLLKFDFIENIFS